MIFQVCIQFMIIQTQQALLSYYHLGIAVSYPYSIRLHGESLQAKRRSIYLIYGR